MTSADAQLQQQLKEAGKQLSNPPASVEELLPILDEVEKLLSKVDQSPRKPMIDALKPSMRALMKDALLKHEDVDVKVAVAACISEITRITAPDAPYEDDVMRDVFQLIVFSFEKLFDESSRSYNKRASILETVSKVRSCVIMLDLECDELIVEMFEHFLNSVRDYHPDSIFSSMENIMVLVLEESEEIPVEMLKPLLAIVKKDNTGVLPVARKLVEGVFLKSAEKLKPYLKPALESLRQPVDMYTKVVISLCEDATATLENNDENTSGLQSAKEDIKLEKGSVDETPQADESKLTTASSENSDQVVKEEATREEEASREEEVDRTVDRSPKSVTSNGVSEAGNEEPTVDQESKKPKEEISQQPVNKEDSDDDSNTDKLAKTKSPTEETFKSEETKADIVVNSAEPSDSSHVEGEKEIEKDNDVKEPENEKDDDEDDDGVKQSETEKVKDDVKESEIAKDNDNDDKESESEAVIPPETEKDSDDKKPAETANASSPSESNSLSEDKPIRSKKKPVPQGDETASPSNGRSKNKSLTREEPPEEQKAGKKTVIAKESELPDTVNESEEDGEPSSDSDAKPLKKSATKPRSKLNTKAGKQSGRKSKPAGKKMDVKQTGKKLDVKGEDSDDSDAKPLKTSVKKGQKSKTIVDDDEDDNSDSDAKPLKTSGKKGEKSKATVDDDEDSDSDAKPLKTSVKKGEKSKKTVDDDEDSDSDARPLKTSVKKGSLKKKDTGKIRGNGKNLAEKDQSEDDEMDISPKLLTKSAKGEGNSKETPVTSAKRKRTAGKDNKSDAIKYDESLIGTKVKVWWPEDKMYYEGVVAEFYPAKKKHKVSYVDGDEEVLLLKTQKWEILQEFSRRDDKEQTTEAQSEEEASPEIHKKKKSRTDTAPSRSQEKVKDSAKRVGGASSSGKSKKENSGAKSTQKTSGKSSDAAADSEDEETPKAGTKTINKSKGKTPQSGGKTNTNGPTKGKSGSSNVKTPESGKGKSTETAKGGSKSGNKRKKRG